MEKELKEFGITVNVISPGGFTDTPMAGEGVLEKYQKMGRAILKPTVLNETISFLASKKAEGISGEKIIGKDFEEWLKGHGF